MPNSTTITLSDEVRAAINAGRPVVALESTLLAHGLSYPANIELAREVDAIVRDAGAVPATVAVIRGLPTIGLDDEAMAILTQNPGISKLSARDLAIAMGTGIDGATTVASTAALAAAVGISVFATGGLGGVHRDARESFDESADLATLARTPIVVVCAGVKSLLDISATLERLESLNVAVAGYRTNRFPGFYRRDSGYPVDWSLDNVASVARVAHARTASPARTVPWFSPTHCQKVRNWTHPCTTKLSRVAWLRLPALASGARRSHRSCWATSMPQLVAKVSG